MGHDPFIGTACYHFSPRLATKLHLAKVASAKRWLRPPSLTLAPNISVEPTWGGPGLAVASDAEKSFQCPRAMTGGHRDANQAAGGDGGLGSSQSAASPSTR